MQPPPVAKGGRAKVSQKRRPSRRRRPAGPQPRPAAKSAGQDASKTTAIERPPAGAVPWARCPDWAQTAYDDYAKPLSARAGWSCQEPSRPRNARLQAGGTSADGRRAWRIEAAIPAGTAWWRWTSAGTEPYHQGPGRAAARLAAGGRRRGPCWSSAARMAWSRVPRQAAHERIRLSDLDPAAAMVACC